MVVVVVGNRRRSWGNEAYLHVTELYLTVLFCIMYWHIEYVRSSLGYGLWNMNYGDWYPP